MFAVCGECRNQELDGVHAKPGRDLRCERFGCEDLHASVCVYDRSLVGCGVEAIARSKANANARLNSRVDDGIMRRNIHNCCDP